MEKLFNFKYYTPKNKEGGKGGREKDLIWTMSYVRVL